MKTTIPKATTTSLRRAFIPLAIGFFLLFESHSARAAVITMNANDGAGASSFNSGAHWTGGAAPVAGTDYSTGGFQLRTPGDGGNYTFAGDSLTVTGSQLTYKGSGNTTITINNLHLNGGYVNSSSAGFTLAGSVFLDAAGTNANFYYTAGSIPTTTITAAVGGTGLLKTSGAGTWILSHANNTYSGGTELAGSGNLDVKADGALGTGNIKLTASNLLTLEGGTTNNYIANTATLTLSQQGTISLYLNFTGTDSLAGVNLWGTNYTTYGQTFGGVGSGATHEYSWITGNGLLQIVPEPATWALLAFSLTTVMVLRRRRN